MLALRRLRRTLGRLRIVVGCGRTAEPLPPLMGSRAAAGMGSSSRTMIFRTGWVLAPSMQAGSSLRPQPSLLQGFLKAM